MKGLLVTSLTPDYKGQHEVPVIPQGLLQVSTDWLLLHDLRSPGILRDETRLKSRLVRSVSVFRPLRLSESVGRRAKKGQGRVQGQSHTRLTSEESLSVAPAGPRVLSFALPPVPHHSEGGWGDAEVTGSRGRGGKWAAARERQCQSGVHTEQWAWCRPISKACQ